MAKELIRVPRVLGESYNSVLIERLYEAGGNVMLDLIIYLGSYHLKDLFGTSWFSVEDFCRKMGYDRTNLQRKLDSRQLAAMFGKNMQPEYVCTDTAGQRISHPIETVFEAALYKLGLENLCYPTIGEDGRTSYNFVQILKRFDIMTDFKTKKSTKRLYSAVVSPEIKNFMFSLYNLLELQDYRSLPSRYRYFYLELSKMVYLIKYKTTKNEAPFYVLTVDQLAKKLGIEIAEPKDRKKKVASILKKMNTYLKYTNFNFSFVKGDHERWAYTVLFSFPRHTLHYFDEGQYAVVVKKFYKNLLGLMFDQQNGVVNEALKSMGLLNEGLYWLKDGYLARIVVMIMCTWKYMGYYMVLLLAGITSISSDIYEAARIDGAGMVTTFFRITLPLMKNTLTFVIIQGMIGSLQLVEDPMTLLTGWISGGQSAVAGGPDRSSLTMMWYMYDTGFGTNMNYGYAASIAYATFIIIAIFAFIINMLLDRRGKDGE